MLVDLLVLGIFIAALALIAIAAATPPSNFMTPAGKTRVGIDRARVADTTGRTTNRRNP